MREYEPWSAASAAAGRHQPQAKSSSSSYYNTEAAIASTSQVQYTYGEEITLEQASFGHLSNRISTPSKWHHQDLGPKANDSTTTKQQMLEAEDSELEEGEVLEEGEIEEELSSEDDEDMIAAALIARPFKLGNRLTGSGQLSIDASSTSSAQSRSKQDEAMFKTAANSSKRRIDDLEASYYDNGKAKPSHQTISTTTTIGQDESTAARRERLLTEFDKLVDDLHTWGATCDYLIGKGVTRDSVIGVFGRKGYKLPQVHFDRYNECLLQQSDHRASLESQQVPAAVKAAQSLPKPVVLPGEEHPQPQTVPFPVLPSQIKPQEPSAPRPPSPPVMRMGLLIQGESTSLPSSKKRKHSSPIVAQATPVEPPPPAPTPTPTTTTTTMQSELELLKAELRRKEAEAREALLARKAAQAKKAAALEANSFIESLLASAATDASTEVSQEATVMEADRATLVDPRDVSPELEAYEDDIKEQHVSIAHVLPAPAASSLPTNLQSTKPRNRPVATDFEADPTQSLANVPRWSERLQEAQDARSAYGTMVIDLSDSEDDDDDSNSCQTGDVVRAANQNGSLQRPYLKRQGTSSEGLRVMTNSHSTVVNGQANSASLPSRALSPTATTSRSASPHLALGNAPSTALGSSKSQELEAKQQEIRRMLDRIKALEGKKRSGSNSSVSSPRPEPRTVAATMPSVLSEKAVGTSAPMLRQDSASDTAMSISEGDST